MNKTGAATLLVVSANLALTAVIAYKINRAKVQMDAEIEELRTKTNRALRNFKSAIADLEV